MAFTRAKQRSAFSRGGDKTKDFVFSDAFDPLAPGKYTSFWWTDFGLDVVSGQVRTWTPEVQNGSEFLNQAAVAWRPALESGIWNGNDVINFAKANDDNFGFNNFIFSGSHYFIFALHHITVAANQHFIDFFSDSNEIKLDSNSTFRMRIDGTNLDTDLVPAATQQILEWSYNANTGESKVYYDGVQFGGTLSVTPGSITFTTAFGAGFMRNNTGFVDTANVRVAAFGYFNGVRETDSAAIAYFQDKYGF